MNSKPGAGKDGGQTTPDYIPDGATMSQISTRQRCNRRKSDIKFLPISEFKDRES